MRLNLLLLGLCLYAAGLMAGEIHPVPRSMLNLEGRPFTSGPGTRILAVGECASGDAERSGIVAVLQKNTGQPPEVSRPGPDEAYALMTDVIIAGEMSSPGMAGLLADVHMPTGPGCPGSEGYVLAVTAERVVVAGRDPAGTFFGLLSLRQLMEGAAAIPTQEIADWPAYPMRAVYLAMEPALPAPDYETACAVVRRAAELKYNQVCVEAGNGGYARLEMASGQPGRTIAAVMTDFFACCRDFHQAARPEGHARYFPRGIYPMADRFAGDPTELEGIRTVELLKLTGTDPAALTIQRYTERGRPDGEPVPVRQVLHDIRTGRTWDREPLVVRSSDDTVTYEEGRDFTVLYGRIKAHWFKATHYGKGQPRGYPYSVLRWAEYDKDCEPTTVQRTAGSRIPDGGQVHVEFTCLGPDPYSRWKYRECLCDPRQYRKDRANPVYRYCVDPFDMIDSRIAVFGLEFDEYRTIGWDNRCLTSGRSRPQIWADFIRFHAETIRGKNPDIRIVMWSDMMDPAHNGDDYRTTGAAEILAAAGLNQCIIAQPWHSGKADASVRYLAEQGFSILPSCQGSTPDADALKWRYFMDKYYSSGQASGFQYTHWNGLDGWRAILSGSDARGARAMGMVSATAWGRAPYISLDVPQRDGDDLVFTARVRGDAVHYTPLGSSGEAVVADDAGRGGVGRTVEGACPIDAVILHCWVRGNPAVRSIAMEPAGPDTYRVRVPAAGIREAACVVDAADRLNTSRGPAGGWLTFRCGTDGPVRLTRLEVPMPVPDRPRPAGFDKDTSRRSAGEPGPEWEVRFSDDFERADLGPDWQVLGGDWRITDGALTVNADPADKTLMCALAFTGAQRLEFDARSDQPGDLSGILRTDLGSGMENGYFFGFGSNGNSCAKLMIRGRTVDTGEGRIVPGQVHHIVCQVEGSLITHSVDGRVLREYRLEKPLQGTGHECVGLYAWNGAVIDNVRIWNRKE